MSKENAWVMTYMGIKFHPFKADPSEIDILDIAHALSNICRWNGHCNYFYSVGQHSIMVCQELKARGFSPTIQLLGLLHDASEAYICDIPKPLKPFMEGYMEVEEKLEGVILQKLMGFTPTEVQWAPVHLVDEDALWTEALALKSDTSFVPRVPVMKTTVKNKTPLTTRFTFMQLYEKLRAEIDEQR
jgi:uncharacterized protein